MIEKLPTYLLYVVTLLLLLLFISPYSTAFIQSDSMSPEIQTGDMFFIEDAEKVQVGDIIVYESVKDRRLVTHRVVAEEPSGFITKGDGNPSTDQELSEPPVSEDQIVGKVVVLGGSALAIPNLGFLSQYLALYRIQILGLLFMTVLLDTFRQEYSTNRKQTRDSKYPKPLYIIFYTSIILIVLWASFIFVISETLESESFTITEGDTDEPRTIKVGETENFSANMTVTESMFPLYSKIDIDSGGRVVSDSSESILSGEEERLVRYEVGPFEDEGVRSVSFRLYSYPHTLPSGVIDTLHSVHPMVAALSTVGVIPLPLVILTMIFTDNSPVRKKGSGGAGRFF